MLNYTVIDQNTSDQWLVMIHGAGGNTKTWQYQISAYQPYFKILLLDLRGHGESRGLQPDYDRYNLDLVINDILQVIDHLHIQQASFVSLSMGSFLMQHLIFKRPVLVQKCVMAGAVIIATKQIKFFTKLALNLNHVFTYKQMYRIFSKLLMPKQSHALSRRMYMIQAEKLTKKEYVRWLGLYDEFFGLLKRFSDWHIPFPTLLVMGADDYVFLPGAKRFSTLQANVSLVVIPDSGHICNIDQREIFNNVSLSFLLNEI